ncbi:MAG: hypothetical protein AAGD38_24300, partial [Acidobacteriota bacterium]
MTAKDPRRSVPSTELQDAYDAVSVENPAELETWVQSSKMVGAAFVSTLYLEPIVQVSTETARIPGDHDAQI